VPLARDADEEYMQDDIGLKETSDAEAGRFDEDSDDDLIDESPPSLGSELMFVLLSLAVMLSIWYISSFNARLAAVAYAIAFFGLAWSRLHLAMALAFAMVPFQQDLGGLPVKIAIAELNLALLVPCLVLQLGKFPISSRLIVPSIFYLLFCLIVSLDSLDRTALVSLAQMVLYLIVAVGVFAQAEREPQEFYWCFDCLVLITTLFAIAGLATNFQFLEIHKNGWGASLSLALIVAFEMWQNAEDSRRKKWLMIAVGILSLALILTVSRGGWLAAMTGITVLLALRRDWATIVRLAMIVVPVAALGWMLLPEDLQQYSVGFESSRENIRLRWESVNLAMYVWQESPWTGSGVGLRKEYDATNVALMVLAETGVIGLMLFALIHVNTAVFVWQSHKWLPSNSIAFSCVALGGALLAARLAHGMVDHYWSRGAILAAWAAVGIAISVARDETE
jgi:hypothetical protein